MGIDVAFCKVIGITEAFLVNNLPILGNENGAVETRFCLKLRKEGVKFDGFLFGNFGVV